METALGKHIMQIFKSPCKKPVRDHGAKVRFSGTMAAEAIPQPFFMVRRILQKTYFLKPLHFGNFKNSGMKQVTRIPKTVIRKMPYPGLWLRAIPTRISNRENN